MLVDEKAREEARRRIGCHDDDHKRLRLAFVAGAKWAEDMLREAGLLAEGEEWGYARIPCAIVSMPSEDIAREVAGQHGGYISIMRRAVGPWVEVP